MAPKLSPLLLAALALYGCTRHAPEPAASNDAVPPPPAASEPPASPPPAPKPKADPAAGAACGELGCRSFDSPDLAFAAVLAEKPLVLGIGEAHAQKGTEHIPSSTKRFTETLLPTLKGRASLLVVELMLPNDKCKKETKQVEKQQKPVTKPQAETNQNEYVVLGQRAKALGIVPDLLRPSCDDLTRITQAGAGDIGVMLETIANLTKTMVGGELDRNAKLGKELLVVAYGGALHNDAEPKPGREAWTYGPALRERTGGRYVALDLIVPEYIKDGEPWASLPWTKHYDRERLGDKAVLYETGKGSYVMVLPVTKAAAKPAASSETPDGG